MQSQVPALVSEYFGESVVRDDHPAIVQAFRFGQGWKTYPMTKRVSLSWLRKMRADGYTTVSLACGGRQADFTIAEIIRHAERPLFGGRVI